MAVHMQLLEKVVEHVREHLLKPLEERVAALEAQLGDADATAKAAPVKTTARGRGKAAPTPEPEPLGEPEASLNDVVAAADEAETKSSK